MAFYMAKLIEVNKSVASVISAVESVFYVLVAVLLAAMALEVLYQSIRSLLKIDINGNATLALVSVLNEVLFVIILLELMSTVYNHLRHGGFQLRPFLIIGVVSSVRRILVLGAQLSTLHHGLNNFLFNSSLTELVVDTFVVIALTFALYLHSRSRGVRKRLQSSTKPPDTAIQEV